MWIIVPSKNISISVDVYDLLQNMKVAGESFSQVIRRLAKMRSIGECAGLFSDLDEIQVEDLLDGIRRARQFEPGS